MEHNHEIMRLLVISREVAALRALWPLVEAHSWQLETASTGWEGLERIQSGLAPHLLILDLARGDRDSLLVVRWLRRLRSNLPILLLCHSVDSTAKEDAIRLGADEVLIRPFSDEQFEFAINRCLRPNRSDSELQPTSEHVELLGSEGYFVSVSPLMNRVRAQAELLAQADVPVLILGEAGTGKKTIARLIHQRSVRSGFRLLRVNCAAVPGDLQEKELFGVENAPGTGLSHAIAGKVEIAGKGILLLEDVTYMPNHLQQRLLRVLQDGQFTRSGGARTLTTDVRILVSTSANIERALAEKQLREDLYYRLSAFTVHVPPLRQRREEIPILLRHFMTGLSKHYGLPARDFSNSVLSACQDYSWPGNLNELETFVKRYLVAGGEVALGDVVAPGSPASDEPTDLTAEFNDAVLNPSAVTADPKSLKSLIRSVKSETERNAIGVALEKTGWNRKAAARLLRVSYRTLLYKIEEYQLHANESFATPISGIASPFLGTTSKSKVS